MLKTKIVTLAVAALAALTVALSATAAPPPTGQPHGAPVASGGVVGQVYVNDNTAPVNTVAAFNRLADGTLTPVAGSPFAVGGSGTGHPDASQGSLELSADGRYLLAVDAGSNQISVLRIKPDGSLQIAEGSPVASNGVDPVSIAISDDLVYVANAGPGTNPGDTNYTGFTLNPGGHLEQFRARPTCCRTAPSPAMSSSTAMATGSSAPASRARKSTASPSATTDT